MYQFIPFLHFNKPVISSWSIGPNSEPLSVADGVSIDPQFLIGSVPPGGASPVLSYLNSFEPGIIDFIEVLIGAEAAVYGVRGGNGVIVVNTKVRSSFEQASVGIIKYIHKIYNFPSSFEFPDYSKKGTRKSPLPDNRPTLYWNGDYIAHKEVKQSFNFSTDDEKGTFTLTVHGFTASGSTVESIMKIVVK